MSACFSCDILLAGLYSYFSIIVYDLFSCFSFFLILSKYNWHITLCKFQVYSLMIRYTYVCKMIPTIRLVNGSITSHNYIFLCVVRTLKIYSLSNFEVSNTAFFFTMFFKNKHASMVKFLESHSWSQIEKLRSNIQSNKNVSCSDSWKCIYQTVIFLYLRAWHVGISVCIIVNQANGKETLYKPAIARSIWTHNLGRVENWMMGHILPTLIFTIFKTYSACTQRNITFKCVWGNLVD